MPRFQTIAEFHRSGHGIWAFCTSATCARAYTGAWLDLDKLDPGLRIDQLRERLRCELCRAPGQIRLITDGVPRR